MLRHLERGGLAHELLVGGLQSIAQSIEFAPQVMDRVTVPAELQQLRGVLALELVDLHLQASRRYREFGAQQVLVGCDFRH